MIVISENLWEAQNNFAFNKEREEEDKPPEKFPIWAVASSPSSPLMTCGCSACMVESATLRWRMAEYVHVCGERSDRREDALLERRLARLRTLHGRRNTDGSELRPDGFSSVPGESQGSTRSGVLNLSDRVHGDWDSGSWEGFGVWGTSYTTGTCMYSCLYNRLYNLLFHFKLKHYADKFASLRCT